MNTKNNMVSEELFWIPKSCISQKKFIKVWFVEKEIKKKFNKDLNPQTRLI